MTDGAILVPTAVGLLKVGHNQVWTLLLGQT